MMSLKAAKTEDNLHKRIYNLDVQIIEYKCPKKFCLKIHRRFFWFIVFFIMEIVKFVKHMIFYEFCEKCSFVNLLMSVRLFIIHLFLHVFVKHAFVVCDHTIPMEEFHGVNNFFY